MIRSVINSFSNLGLTDGKSLVFVISTVLAANLGLYLVNRLRMLPPQEETNTLSGIFFGAISVLYSLILAFVIMAQWDDYADLNKTVASETDKLNSIISHSAALPDGMKAAISRSLSAYCQQVINAEWTMQARDSSKRPSAIPALRHLLLTTAPANGLQENVLAVIDEDLSAISDLRRNRLSHTHSQLPSLVWFILAVGAVMLVVFCYFFRASSVKMQSLYLSFFVCLLAICLSIVYNLDHPFAPGSGVDNGAYQKILSELQTYFTPGKKMAYLSYCRQQ